MAKDDYTRIVGIILAYLYAKLRGRTEERPEVYLQPMTKDFPVEEEYFYFILEEMQKKGWISGLQFLRNWGDDLRRVAGMSRIRITGDGIQYLCDNSAVRKKLEWIRDNAPALPGMVTTIVEILDQTI